MCVWGGGRVYSKEHCVTVWHDKVHSQTVGCLQMAQLVFRHVSGFVCVDITFLLRYDLDDNHSR